MRNLLESMRDKYNADLAAQIESLIAPSGYQKNSKYGNVALRGVITEDVVMDISYKIILENAKLKSEYLRYIMRELRIVNHDISSINLELDQLIQDHGRARFWLWLSGVLAKHDELVRRLRVSVGKLMILEEANQFFLSKGPHVPDEVMRKLAKA